MKSQPCEEFGGVAAVPDIARELEKYYAAPMPLTLAKLRTALRAIGEMLSRHPGRSHSLSDVHIAIRDLGFEGIPFQTISILIEAVTPLAGKEVLQEFSLKQLENLLTRMSR